MKYTFEVNRCADDLERDEIHHFVTLTAMRQFIDIDDTLPMEVTVFCDGEPVISLFHSSYWRTDKHPTLKQLLGDNTQ